MTLEKLFSTLIQKGWKPFGINYYCYFNIRERIEIICGPFGGGEYILEKTPSLRQLVSKESGLWQYCVENDMVDDGQRVFKLFDMRGYRHKTIFDDTCEYWLMQSSLKDESELKEFLLDNIQIGK